ncbi:MAG: ATP-binding protein [Proteobacteria bacterium]|nr:ATP-binding protein [Pseudomonadota bacterium]
MSSNTINTYLSYLEDAFIVHKALRYDVKGKKYINTPYKYYYTDVGLRNARLNFRQQEASHIMENIIYNELLMRGLNVDGNNQYYIQSALNLDTPEKLSQETRSLNHIEDSLKKIIIVKDHIKPWRTEDGMIIMGVLDFLLDPNCLVSS